MGATIMSSPAPVCSVCIANYNGIEVLQECIDSVCNQNCDFPIEIIIHDDASTDESVSFIQHHYPEAVLIKSQQNVGFCIANNRMVEKAGGQFVLLLNNDAALLPDALATLMREAQQLKEPAILGLPQYDAQTDELLDIGSLLDPFLNPVPNKDPNRKEVGMIMGACLWIPKILWEELGGFPEWFGSIAEDMYLCCLARLQGSKVIVVGLSGYRHQVGRSFGGGRITGDRLATNRRRRMLSERNKSFVMVVSYPAPWFYLFFPLHLIAFTIEGVVLALWNFDRTLFMQIYGYCLQALWREQIHLASTRCHTQKRRAISAHKFFSPFTIVPYKLIMLLRYGFPKIQ